MSHSQPKRDFGFATKAIHDTAHQRFTGGPLVPPIYQTSTFVFPTAEEGAERFAGEASGYIYSRLGNPTVSALEEKIASLEKAEMALAFSSGMAAVSAVLMALVKTGDHILCSKGMYGCTFSLLNWLQNRFGVEHSLSTMSDEEMLRQAIKPNTKLIYVETPVNPTMELIDLEMVGRVGKELGIITIVDNTFMSPYLQRPIEWGCDLVIHSATKYIGGHGDVIAGLVAGPRSLLEEVLKTTQKDFGGVLGPMDAFLLLRGLKTLAVRMEAHTKNAQAVAKFLTSHPQVERVRYPGLPEFPQHALAQKQMDGFGGVVSFELKGGHEAATRMLNHVSLCRLAVSLGDVDSLIQHPASMTHAIVPREERLNMGITDGLIRLSVGIEEVQDIICDLENALSFV
ncbi:methionine-gamma-lyase [Laceyella tengchongensis]|uniref:L-methionine gamma-lyase n=1 Tax=Laceyella tengchongensis TaxID=574699 RepID=A0AA45WNC3_9BACL|nr:methionine gamma-lyase [Laceyella tengchongensis]SMP17375.1 methionine-gamma-lyase [Laceyella tengchongensis]